MLIGVSRLGEVTQDNNSGSVEAPLNGALHVLDFVLNFVLNENNPLILKGLFNL